VRSRLNNFPDLGFDGYIDPLRHQIGDEYTNRRIIFQVSKNAALLIFHTRCLMKQGMGAD